MAFIWPCDPFRAQIATDYYEGGAEHHMAAAATFEGSFWENIESRESCCHAAAAAAPLTTAVVPL
jgi:hypothetical protein